ncbi:uncharacterized protein MEPE_01086 [Melanopsichium pennsylvanicum]|uniref:RRM domain-containing protein n=1 Tax=Melanopsichium pennsylvanicum TaxID=63383 RepID=A0AAJ5C398_9BASI|nr:uncharacterized protein MEPE_01086 [Melanopsichium pennsylvanicum]
MDRLDQPLSSFSNTRSSRAQSRNSPYSRYSRSSAPSEGAASWKHDRYQHDTNSHHAPRNAPFRASIFFPQDESEINKVKPTGKLTIENLHYDVSERDLKQLFESIGPVTKSYIKYDRHDRSTGKAVVIYDNPNHAIQAKNEFDGAKAKGQVISITQEMRADRPKQAQHLQPSLLSRFDLSSRDDSEAINAAAHSFADRLGPVRYPSRDGGQRGTSRGGNQPARARNAPAKSEKRKPVTAADLDAELEAFMNAPTNTTTATTASHAHQSHMTSNGLDVEMS